MKLRSLLPLSLLILSGCQDSPGAGQPEQWKQEILEAEADFNRMAGERGIAEAFLAFAAEDAVLMRNNRVIEGRDAMREWFEGQPTPPGSVRLEWKPDFTDVSASGDLGYTYGTYTLTLMDSLGAERKQAGIFHTVWKRQADGTWKFVWD